MKTAFHSSFAKDLRSIKEQNLQDRIAELIQTVEQAADLSAVPNLEKLRAAEVLTVIWRGERSGTVTHS